MRRLVSFAAVGTIAAVIFAWLAVTSTSPPHRPPPGPAPIGPTPTTTRVATTVAAVVPATAAKPVATVTPPARTEPAQTTSTTSGRCPDLPRDQEDPAQLDTTITFAASAMPDEPVKYEMTVANHSDRVVAAELDLGTVFVVDNVNEEYWRSVTTSDLPPHEWYCPFGSLQYLVVAPGSTLREQGTVTFDDSVSTGPHHVSLWTQAMMVPGTEFGGPGGTLTVVAPATTTTT
jgi:hypothetical protein